jgi:DNA (cytosine-5)-methyltransferase 1
MNKVYVENHNPKFNYLEGIQTFKLRDDLPEELYNLDILDGSPPCSSFSMAGNREKDWGKEKKFKEGQAEQVLDTLFFDFIDLAEKLKPKVVIAENVKGMLVGDAQKYVNKILQAFNEAGYYVTYKLLNASKMGVPQRRERVFFTAIRKDLYKGDFIDLFQSEPILKLQFNEKEIPYKDVRDNKGNDSAFKIGPKTLDLYRKCKPGKDFGSVHPKGSYFNEIKLHMDFVPNTIRATGLPYDPIEERYIYNSEVIKIGAFPADYDFGNLKPNYMIGMSVPPLMTARIANEVKKQWLDKL